MGAKIIDGKAIALEIKNNLKKEIEKLKANNSRVPGIAVIRIGEDPASAVYVKNKLKSCSEIGFKSEHIHLEETETEDKVLSIIKNLNEDKTIDGILVQLPLPKHIDEKKILDTILPEKDVDGFHPHNFGLLLQYRDEGLKPCTSSGTINILKQNLKLDLAGKKAVVIGNSNIVGKPMAIELMREKCTVTTCNSKTKSLEDEIKNADIVISAVGIPNLIKGNWIKEGSIVIDIGINRLPSGKLTGDVEFEVAKERASYITPVPGGIGPITVATLLQNTFKAFKA